MKTDIVTVDPIVLQKLFDAKRAREWKEIMEMDDDDDDEYELSSGTDWGLSFAASMIMLSTGAILTILLLLALGSFG